MKIYFVRHAESQNNTLGSKALAMHNTSLTIKGEKQALSLAAFFTDKSVSCILSSPMLRAQQTAKTIGKQLDVSVKTDPSLKERNWGDLGNNTWEELSEQLETLPIHERYAFAPTDGESWQQMEKRLSSFLDNIKHDKVVIVTHKGCLRALFTYLLKDEKTNHKTYSVPLASISCYDSLEEKFEYIGKVIL